MLNEILLTIAFFYAIGSIISSCLGLLWLGLDLVIRLAQKKSQKDLNLQSFYKYTYGEKDYNERKQNSKILYIQKVVLAGIVIVFGSWLSIIFILFLCIWDGVHLLVNRPIRKPEKLVELEYRLASHSYETAPEYVGELLKDIDRFWDYKNKLDWSKYEIL